MKEDTQESAAGSVPSADADPRRRPDTAVAGGSFTLYPLTDKGRERLPEIERLLAPLLKGEIQ